MRKSQDHTYLDSWFVAQPVGPVENWWKLTPAGLIADGPRERASQIRNGGEKAIGQPLIPLAGRVASAMAMKCLATVPYQSSSDQDPSAIPLYK